MRFELKDEYAWHLWFAWHPVEVRRKDGTKEAVLFEKVLRRSLGTEFFTKYAYKLAEVEL